MGDYNYKLETKEIKMASGAKCCFITFFALKFLVLLAAFGISCYLFAEVKKQESDEYPANKNALAMIPICFTGFALLVSIIGIFGITKCKNKCVMFLYISLAIICVIGFGAACITAGVWLGGGSVIPDGAFNKNDIGNKLFQEVCDTENPNDPLETLKSVGQNVTENEVTDFDSFLDAAKKYCWWSS